MASLTLYNYFRSSTSYRTRIALHYKNLEFEYKPVHLLNNGGEQHSEDYKKMNSMAEVPTLVHDGKVMGQSMAIIEYLDEVFPKNPLFPKDPFKKTRVRQFCENINSFMHPLSNLKVLQYLEKNHQYDQAKKEEWVSHWLTKGFQALEQILKNEGGKFCFGNEVTAADMFLIPQIFSAERFKVSLEPFPLCRMINSECIKLESFKKAHPFRQPDTPEEARLK
jgi:maleylacetoacetate isomerase